MSKQDSEMMKSMEMGDEDGPVELLSLHKVSTEDSIEVPSPASPAASSDDGGAEHSIAAVDNEASSDKLHDESPGGANGKEEGEGGGEGTGTRKDKEEVEEEVRSKRGAQGSIQKLQRPESLEIDEQLAPKISSRNPRKSVLKNTQPTPVHTGSTYTCTAPVGEPYNSGGQKRQGGGRECCSVM